MYCNNNVTQLLLIPFQRNPSRFLLSTDPIPMSQCNEQVTTLESTGSIDCQCQILSRPALLASLINVVINFDRDNQSQSITFRKLITSIKKPLIEPLIRKRMKLLNYDPNGRKCEC